MGDFFVDRKAEFKCDRMYMCRKFVYSMIIPFLSLKLTMSGDSFKFINSNDDINSGFVSDDNSVPVFHQNINSWNQNLAVF